MAVATVPQSTVTKTPREGFWDSRVMRRFRRNPLAITGFVISSFFVLVAVFAPLLAPPQGNCLRDLNVPENSSVYNPFGSLFWKAIVVPPNSCFSVYRISFSSVPTPPGVDGAIFGTTGGYDIFYGLVWGTRTAFQLSLLVVIPTLLIGIVVGSIAGFFGGWVDNLFMRFVDIIFAFPGLILNIVIVSILGRGLDKIALAFVLVGWASYARVVRGAILKVRALEYVDAARALGASNFQMIFKHVLPNSLTTILAIVVLDFGTVPLSAAALSFLGLGTPEGFADWGQMIAYARAFIVGPAGNPFGYWYVSFFPALVILLFGLGWSLLGDALRDALDPRER
ncbi:MAG: ABC transporter permease [Pleurocapsa sp. SU_196_0]|nr:ABC transporter permease [Pleurocapsa sp. SU_196_0]